MDAFETRTKRIIKPLQINLIEVPFANITETRTLLEKLKLPIEIIPMEIGEVVSFLCEWKECIKPYT